MRAWVLVVPPGASRQDWLASLALARTHGAVYDQARRVPLYIGYRLPEALESYAAPPFSWEAFLTDEINGEVSPPPIATGRFVPRPIQREAAAAIVAAAAAGYRGFLEADDVGTGKTISCLLGMLEVAQIRPMRTLLIVCPKSAIPHWRRTVADMGTRGVRVAIINYDRLRSLLTIPASAAAAVRTRTKNKRIVEQGQPLVRWDGVIFDESHKLRAYGFDNDSQRALAAASLARYADTAADAPFVVWASATAGHAVHEVGYLAPLLAELTGQTLGSVRDYGPWLQQQGFHVLPGGYRAISVDGRRPRARRGHRAISRPDVRPRGAGGDSSAAGLGGRPLDSDPGRPRCRAARPVRTSLDDLPRGVAAGAPWRRSARRHGRAPAI